MYYKQDVVSFTEILTNICLREKHNATITRGFALFCAFFTNAFSPKFCSKMLLENTYIVIALEVYTRKSSAPASRFLCGHFGSSLWSRTLSKRGAEIRADGLGGRARGAAAWAPKPGSVCQDLGSGSLRSTTST